MIRPRPRDPALQRAAIRAELDATRDQFRALVRSLSDADWSVHHQTTAWSVGELLAHLTLSLELIPRQVERARRGKGLRNEPLLLMHAINVHQSRVVARKETVRSIGARYDAAHAVLLALLEEIQADEWERSGRFFHRHQTIRDLVHRPVTHFHEHAAQIRASVVGRSRA